MSVYFTSVAHICLDRGYTTAHRQVELLIRGLSELHVQQYLVCRDDSPLQKRLQALSTPVKIIKIYGIADPRFTGHFKLLRKATLMHAHDKHGANWAFIHYLLTGTPYVITLRSKHLLENTIVNKAMLSWAKKVFATQTYIKTLYAENFDFHDIDVVRDCTTGFVPNEANVASIRASLKGRFIIGMVGDLVNRLYGQSVLIEAMQILSSTLPEAVVLFIGSGDDQGLLKEKAMVYPNIKFLGTPKFVTDYIASFDVFVYPVNEEGNTSVLLDALDLQIPIVASDVGSISEIVKDEHTGFLVPPRDPKALAEAILRVKKEKKLVALLTKNGYDLAHDHQAEYMAGIYHQQYSIICAND